MQTSSNFFNKSLFALDEQTHNHKKTDKYHQSHIVPDPLRLKQQLTPWTQINPKYNFNTERLIKFKQKINQQQQIDPTDEEVKQVKQIKSQMISNLFNFYKNNKEKKKSTLNNAKRKSKLGDILDETNEGWTLPPIMDGQELQEDLVQKKQSLKKNQQKNEKKDSKPDKKQKGNAFIQSISIRDYLMKLKEKEKVFSSPQIIDKSNLKDHKFDTEDFTSNRHHPKVKTKGLSSNSINTIRDLGGEDLSYRYGPIRNPENQSYKKRTYLSPLQSLQQSFQIYKKAAQLEVHDSLGSRKILEKNPRGPNAVLIAQKQYWRNNVPLSSLFSSNNLQSAKRSRAMHESISPIKKYNTISYDRSFSPTQHSVQLPKLSKNHSHRQ